MKRFIPYNSKHIDRARTMRKTMTRAEKKIWFEVLKPLQKLKEIRILKQRPIDQFIVDFYMPSLKLVIEIDGESHFDEQGIAYDVERTQILEGKGLQILRFTNLEVMENIEGVYVEVYKFITQKDA